MNQSLLDSYATEAEALAVQVAKVEELRTAILTLLQQEGIEKAQAKGGTFSVIPRVSYEYPPDVDAKKKIWEDAKKNAISNEKVTKTEMLSLRFQAV